MRDRKKESHEERILRWAKKIMAIRLLGGKCSCGISNPLVLEFHHNYGKDNKISDLLGGRWSILEKEVLKCRLLCANCHMETHLDECSNQDQRKRILKLRLLQSRNQLHCMECGYKRNALCLDFHHTGEKRIDISDCIFNRRHVPWEELVSETSRCEVLCRNCHRIKHFGIEFLEMLPLVEDKIIKHEKK